MPSSQIDFQAISALSEPGARTIDLCLVVTAELDNWRSSLSAEDRIWSHTTGFEAEPGEMLWLPGADRPHVAVGWNGQSNLAALGDLPYKLPEGDYRLKNDNEVDLELLVLGWLLGSYRFNRYRTATENSPHRRPAKLQLPDTLVADRVCAFADATTLTRDLINIPAADMLPSDLEHSARTLAMEYQAEIDTCTGEKLLQRGLRTIHAVGRASPNAPRLIDLTWGNPAAPKVTLIGKGVCFDSGGLDIKSANGMRQMKKDMGGAAHVLGLAQLIMTLKLPIRLRVLIPAVENAVAGNAYRPGDVIETYQGLRVEIENTDAEGRLVMCDALTLASEENPELIVDFATLTGAARVAVGTEIAAIFSNDDDLATQLVNRGQAIDDPVWRLPLHPGYRDQLKSNVADLVNSTSTSFGAAITAGLFLERFIGDHRWVHFDMMAFNQRARPGRPEGGEAMGLRALASLLEDRYPQS